MSPIDWSIGDVIVGPVGPGGPMMSLMDWFVGEVIVSGRAVCIVKVNKGK